MDNSLPVKEGARIAINDNQIVILRFSHYLPVRGSEWHGYVVTYEGLNSRSCMRKFINILQKEGLMDKNGKLL